MGSVVLKLLLGRLLLYVVCVRGEEGGWVIPGGREQWFIDLIYCPMAP